MGLLFRAKTSWGRTEDRAGGTPAPQVQTILRALIVLAMVLGVTIAQASAAPIDMDEKAIDQSIAKGLAFLAKQQMESGAWIADSYGESTAATSLSIMAFLAAGHVPGEGPYGEQINRGIRWVLDHQDSTGMLVHRRSHGPMYSHGISTLMLAEVVGMVDEGLADETRQSLERAIRLILEAQAVPKSSRHAGGWRYHTRSRDSDLSVSGWQLLALRAAKDIGCDVPAESIDAAIEYVKNCGLAENKGFAYQPGGAATATRNGTGILALEVCGDHQSPESMGAFERLLDQPLQYNDPYFFYGAYYCSVGMFKIGSIAADAARTDVANILLTHQAADGSWQPSGVSERRAGRVYATSLAVLALGIDYRYLPIYQR